MTGFVRAAARRHSARGSGARALVVASRPPCLYQSRRDSRRTTYGAHRTQFHTVDNPGRERTPRRAGSRRRPRTQIAQVTRPTRTRSGRGTSKDGSSSRSRQDSSSFEVSPCVLHRAVPALPALPHVEAGESAQEQGQRRRGNPHVRPARCPLRRPITPVCRPSKRRQPARRIDILGASTCSRPSRTKGKISASPDSTGAEACESTDTKRASQTRLCLLRARRLPR